MNEINKELYSVLLFVNKETKKFRVDFTAFNSTRNYVMQAELGKAKKLGKGTSVYLLESGNFTYYEVESLVRVYTLLFSREFDCVDFTYENINVREFLTSTPQYAMYRARQVVKSNNGKEMGFSPKYYVMKERELSSNDERIQPLYMKEGYYDGKDL